MFYKTNKNMKVRINYSLDLKKKNKLQRIRSRVKIVRCESSFEIVSKTEFVCKNEIVCKNQIACKIEIVCRNEFVCKNEK